MSEVVWLLIVFVFLNVLDGFTTWLGLYHLPPELRGREANPVFEGVEKKFWPAMIKKGIFVLFGVWFFSHFASAYALKVIDLVFVTAVLNNTYVYLSRRLTGKKHKSPVEYFISFFRKLRLPERAARLVGFYVMFGLVIAACYLIVGAFS